MALAGGRACLFRRDDAVLLCCALLECGVADWKCRVGCSSSRGVGLVVGPLACRDAAVLHSAGMWSCWCGWVGGGGAGGSEVGCSSSQGMGLDDRLAGLAMMLQCCVVLACGAAGGVCGGVGVSEVDCSSSQGTGLDDRLAWLAVMLLCFSQCCNRSVKLLVGDVRSWSQQAAGVWG